MGRRVANTIIMLALCACSAPADPVSVGGDAGTPNLDPDPVFTAEERAALSALRYDAAGPPPDPDDPEPGYR